ncbi:MSRA reductase, partial [Polypterus senegalus]
MSGAEKAEPLMEKTYIHQRRYLNGVPAPHIAQVQKEWPFLFSQRCLYSHFRLLTDISILSKLQEALDNKGSTIIKFCQELSHHSGIQDVLSKFEPEVSVKAACVLLLLMAYFKEPKDAILLQADFDRNNKMNMMAQLNLTKSKKDDMMKPKAWMLSIEGQVVMGPHHDFVNGIATIFASYYNFNLQYPEDASSTLEFIQRGAKGTVVCSCWMIDAPIFDVRQSLRDYCKHAVSGHPVKEPFPEEMERVIFGMGCFWGAERRFWKTPGVYSTHVGYAGGFTVNPLYKEVCSGMRQGKDVGTQYRSVIYTYIPYQLEMALKSKEVYQKMLNEKKLGTITTEIKEAPEFYYAEDYHQQYLHKVPNGYCGLKGTGVSCPIGLSQREDL